MNHKIIPDCSEENVSETLEHFDCILKLENKPNYMQDKLFI